MLGLHVTTEEEGGCVGLVTVGTAMRCFTLDFFLNFELVAAFVSVAPFF